MSNWSQTICAMCGRVREPYFENIVCTVHTMNTWYKYLIIYMFYIEMFFVRLHFRIGYTCSRVHCVTRQWSLGFVKLMWTQEKKYKKESDDHWISSNSISTVTNFKRHNLTQAIYLFCMAHFMISAFQFEWN